MSSTKHESPHGGEYHAIDLVCYQGFANPLCGTNNLNDPEHATYLYQKEQNTTTLDGGAWQAEGL